MASKKKYAYYLRGNQIAVIEENTGLGSGTCSLSNYKNQSACENAGGTWTSPSSSGGDLGVYKSPQESITDGLEIEYTYSPSYLVPAKRADSVSADTYHAYNCWFVVDGYLTLGATFVDFTGFASIAEDSYILIEGSERWNGLHKVKAIQAMSNTVHGGIQTYTRVNEATKYCTDASVTFQTDEDIINLTADFDDIFSASPSSNEYIWISGSDGGGGANNGLYSGWSYSSTTLSFSSATTYYILELTETTQDAVLQADATNIIYIYEAFRENGSAQFYSSVSVMDDESFDLDLPRYQAQAVVYYLKAKIAEDRGDMDTYVYNRNRFRTCMQRHDSSRIWGSRKVLPGVGAIR